MISREQFEKTLDAPIEFWAEKSQDVVEGLLGAPAARMVGFNQNNPHHCYDLYMHTLHTIEAIPKSASVLLRVAAYFHDIGKPDVARLINDRTVYYGHAHKSEEIAGEILEKMGYTLDEIEEIIFYIGHHDDFIPWILPEERDRGAEGKLISLKNLEAYIARYEKKRGDDWKADLICWQNLLHLCLADVSSQAEVVVVQGEVVGTRTAKQGRLKAIQKCIMEIADNSFSIER